MGQRKALGPGWKRVSLDILRRKRIAPIHVEGKAIERTRIGDRTGQSRHAVFVDRGRYQASKYRSDVVDAQIERGLDNSTMLVIGCDRHKLRLIRPVVGTQRPGPCSIVAGVLSDRADGSCDRWTICKVNVGKAS